MEKYTKGRDLMPMIRKMTAIYINSKAPDKPTPTTTRQGENSVITSPSDIDRDQYKMDLLIFQELVILLPLIASAGFTED